MISRYDDLKLQILHAIYEDSFRVGGAPRFPAHEVEKILPDRLILGVTQAIIEDLRSDGYLVMDAQGYYHLAIGGIRFIETELSDEFSKISQILRGQEQDRSPARVVIPAADRVVSLDHNSESYKEAIAALDEAFTEFKEDRLLENEWGPEKSALVRSIEAGRELLERGEVRAATIFATVLTPLQVARERYEHAIVAGLVTAGADQLVNSLGHAITLLLRLIGMA